MGETYEILKDMGRKTLKGVLKTTKIGLKIGLVIPEYIFAGPSFWRKYGSSLPQGAEIPLLYSPHIVLFSLELIATVEKVGDYSYLLLATHVTGNAASGLYEWFRYEKRKRSSPTASSQGASASPLSQSPSKLEEKIKDIPNPWDIDIPEIKYILRGERKDE